MRYTQEQISTALVLLKATGSPDKVIQTLGYPSSPMLYHWRKKYPKYYDVPNQKHWRQAPTELKHDVIKRCIIKGEPVKLVAEEIGYTPSLIYKWIREYREKGCFQPMKKNTANIILNQRIIAGNAQFTGIAAGRGVGFTTGLLLLRKGLGMRETPIRPHSWHCRMQSGYQYGGNRKRPPVWRRHRGSLRPRGRNLGGVEGMTGGCGSGCDPAIHTRRLRVYHRPRRLRMASRISIFFAARRFEPLNSMG